MKDRVNHNIPANDTRSGSDLVWLDALKAFALLWIFWNHVIENIFGGPYFGNPSKNWPGLSERFQQIVPIPEENIFSWVILNLARYTGWLGDQGVQIFLVLSGFGLAYGCLRTAGRTPLNIKQFLIRRFWRIFPLWWGVHFLFVIPSILSGNALSIGSVSFYLSLLGFRASSGLLYYYSPAWWYIGLLIQLYLVFPILWNYKLKHGVVQLFCWAVGICVFFRCLGLLYFEDYLDAWSRGAIFVSRLPEFVLGIALACWYRESRPDSLVIPKSNLVFVLGCVLYVAGNALSFTLVGMALAPLIQAASLSIILFLCTRSSWGSRICSWKWIQWIGRHSYSLFLVHHPLILYLPSPSKESVTITGLMAYGIIMLAAMILLAILLERFTARVEHKIGVLYKEIGILKTIMRAFAWCCMPLIILVGAEITIRETNPQEVLGWGERRSLEPHPEYGWHLKPNTQVRLRWASYDYMVTSNEQGFPAPSFSKNKDPKTFRIITIGDAFTSAEGVDTDQSWPRLMEKDLNQTGKDFKFQVLNYAVTGYGPNQYLAVLKDKIPEYQPDLVVVAFFVNDFFDVQTPDRLFLNSIGFDLPSQDGLYSILSLTHLSSFFLNEVKAPIKQFIRKEPNPTGYFLGNFQTLERENLQKLRAGADHIKEMINKTKRIVDENNSNLITALIPAPVQVSRKDELDYYPDGVDLSGNSRFSMNQPQELMQEVVNQAGLELVDLRYAFIGEEGTYQRKNMHFTNKGHLIVSNFMLNEILKELTPLVADGHKP